jgi:hypothetical protein
MISSRLDRHIEVQGENTKELVFEDAPWALLSAFYASARGTRGL